MSMFENDEPVGILSLSEFLEGKKGKSASVSSEPKEETESGGVSKYWDWSDLAGPAGITDSNTGVDNPSLVKRNQALDAYDQANQDILEKQKKAATVAPGMGSYFSQKEQLRDLEKTDEFQDYESGRQKVIDENPFIPTHSLQDIRKIREKLEGQRDATPRVYANVPPGGGFIPVSEDEEKRAAKRMRYTQSIDFLKAAEKLYNPSIEKDGIKSIISGFGSGIVKDFASAGISELIRYADVATVAEKKRRGEELNDDERSVLTAYGVLREMESGTKKSISYDVARGVKDMIPYMVQFAATGIVGSTAKAATTKLLGSFGNKIAGKAIGYTAGALAQTAVMPIAPTDYFERRIGDVTPDGDLVEGSEDGRLEAAFKAGATAFSEVFTEGLGAYMGRPLSWIARKTGPIGKSVLNPVERFAKAAKFDGWLAEYLEEVVNSQMQPLLTGDRPIGFGEGKSFDPREQLVTLLTVSAMGGGTYGLSKIYDKADNALLEYSIYDLVDTDAAELKRLAGLDDPKEIATGLIDFVNSGQLSESQNKAAIKYVVRSVARNADAMGEKADQLINRLNAELVVENGMNVVTRSDGQVIEAVIGDGKNAQKVWVIEGDPFSDKTVIVRSTQNQEDQPSMIGSGELRDVQVHEHEEYKERMRAEELNRLQVTKLQEDIQDGIETPPTPETITQSQGSHTVSGAQAESRVLNGTTGTWTSDKGPRHGVIISDQPNAAGMVEFLYEENGEEFNEWINPNNFISDQARAEEEQVKQQLDTALQSTQEVEEEPGEPTGEVPTVSYSLPTKGGKKTTLDGVKTSEDEVQINKSFNTKPTSTLKALKANYPKREWKIIDNTEDDPDAQAQFIIVGKSKVTKPKGQAEPAPVATQQQPEVQKPVAESPITEDLTEPAVDKIATTEDVLDVVRKKAAEQQPTPTPTRPEIRTEPVTPEEEREAGYRVVNGDRVRRQNPIEKKASGADSRLYFSNDIQQPGKWTVMEADELQQSHIQRSRNPLHFIPEAQPKERTDQASDLAAEQIANKLDPEVITTKTTNAYSGAPTVNTRGEVIQGNNRVSALKRYWYKYPNDDRGYREYLKKIASETGISPEALDGFTKPVLVNMVDVSDKDAILLGQYIGEDMETGGKSRIRPKETVRKAGDKLNRLIEIATAKEDKEESLRETIRRNGIAAIRFMNQHGMINDSQLQSALKPDGKTLKKEAIDDIEGVILYNIFEGGRADMGDLFERLRYNIQNAIIRSSGVIQTQGLKEDIQDAIEGYHEFIGTKYAQEMTSDSVKDWSRQMDLLSGAAPVERYSPQTLRFIDIFTTFKDQKALVNLFDKLGRLTEGETTIFGTTAPMEFEAAFKETFGVDYDAKKRGNFKVTQGKSEETPDAGRDQAVPAGPYRKEGGTGAVDQPGGGGLRRGEQGQSPQEPVQAVPGSVPSGIKYYKKATNTGGTFYQDESGKVVPFESIPKDATIVDNSVEKAPFDKPKFAGEVIEKGTSEQEYRAMSVDDLVKLKKSKYPNPDITTPMSADEKLLDRIIAEKFSEINQGILEKRKEEKAPFDKPKNEAGDASVPLSQGTQPQAGMSAQEVQKIVDKINSVAVNPPKIVVVANDTEFPEKIRQLASFKPNHIVAAVYPEAIYMNASMLSNRDQVVGTWVHEVGVHHGMTRLIPDKDSRDSLFRQVWMSANAHAMRGNEEYKKIIRFINENYPLRSNIEAQKGNEFLAYLSDKVIRGDQLTNADRTIWQQFINKMKELLARLFNFNADVLTTNEISNIVRAAVETNFSSRISKDQSIVNEKENKYNFIQTQINWGEEVSFKRPENVASDPGMSEIQREADYSPDHSNSITFAEDQLSDRGYLTFMGDTLTGPARIKSANDVAFLFKNLENASTENVFVVHMDDKGKYKVQYLTTGSSVGSIVPIKHIISAAKEFGATRLVMVHNHPSGNLEQSQNDKLVDERIRKAAEVVGINALPGIIINLDSGKFAMIGDPKSDIQNKIEVTASIKKQKIYSFDRRKLYVPSSDRTVIRGSSDIAEFLSKQKRGIVGKVHAIILDQRNSVTKYILYDGNISTDELSKELLPEIGKSGERVVIASSYNLNLDIRELNRLLEYIDSKLLDYIIVKQDEDIIRNYESWVDRYGSLGESESKYGNEVAKKRNPMFVGDMLKEEKFDQATRKKLNQIEKEYNETPYKESMVKFGISEKGTSANVSEEPGTELPATITIDGVERSTTNSEGRPIAPTVEGIRNFYRWFGESKVVDAQGRPLVVYHGTNAEFDSFEKGEFGFHFGTQKQANSIEDIKSILPVYLNLNNPIRIKDLDFWSGEDVAYELKKQNVISNKERLDLSENDYSDSDVKELLSKKGYDGVIYLNRAEFDGSDSPAVGHDRINLPDNKFKEKYNTEDSYIAFNSNQIKSATGNMGSFDPDNNDIVFRTVSPIGFYSTVENALESIKQEKGTPEQFKAMLLKNGAKQAELDYMDFDGTFTGKSITKSDIQDWINQNRIEVQEVEKGGFEWKGNDLIVGGEVVANLIHNEDGTWSYQSDFSEGEEAWETKFDAQKEVEEAIIGDAYSPNATKFSQYTLPGGKNYRELLLTMPEKRVNVTYSVIDDNVRYGGNYKVKNNVTGEEILGSFKTKEAAEKWIQGQSGSRYSTKDNFRSSHFDEPNILAHVRFDEREVDGERVLFIEEWQADKGQEWQKLKKLIDSGKATQADIDRFNFLDKNFPFNKTSEWLPLAMRRMIRYAAENDYDRIAWTTGEQQAERYDLSKQVKKIIYKKVTGIRRVIDTEGREGSSYYIDIRGNNNNIIKRGIVNEFELEDLIGKEIAGKIIETSTNEEQKLSGLDLKVGGEGMKGFYDNIVPAQASKLVKPFGAKLETIVIQTKKESVKVNSIPITESMASSVQQGVPLFRSSTGKNVIEEAKYNALQKFFDKVSKEAIQAGKIHVYSSRSQVPKSLQRILPNQKVSGFYIAQTGESYFILNEIDNVSEAFKTWVHEVGVHAGLRKIIPVSVFNKLMGKIYNDLGTKEIKRLIPEYYWELPEHIQAEEYLAFLAEMIINEEDLTSSEISTWRKIIESFKELLNKLFRNAKFTTNDAETLVKTSVQNLFQRESLAGDMLQGKSRKDYSKRGEDEIRLRVSKLEKMSDGEFREKYRDWVPTMTNLENSFIERNIERTLIDSGQALKNLLDEVEKREVTIGYDKSAYEEQLRSRGKNRTHMEDFDRDFEKPLLEAIADITTNDFDLSSEDLISYRDIEEYLKAKHGLERNEKMNDEAQAKTKGKYTNRIFGGIPTSMLHQRGLKKDASNVNEIRADITYEELTEYLKDTVRKFERNVNSDRLNNLWDKINKATNFTLDRWFSDGFLSLDEYLKLTGEDGYKYYVPLRGWIGDAANDLFEYQNKQVGGAFNPNKKALGRSSEADDTIPYIISMAGSAIVAGNKNNTKRLLLHIARDSRDLAKDLIRVKYFYEVINDRGEWEDVGDARPEQKLFDEKKARIRRDRDVGRASKYEAAQHEVEVFENGEKKIVQLADPQAASAINGENLQEMGPILETLSKFTRFWAALTTSKNPAFIIPNMIRDLRFAFRGIMVDEGVANSMRFMANYGKAQAAILRAVSGKANMDKKYDKLYQQFRNDGGITGITKLDDIKKIKRKMEREVHQLIEEQKKGIKNPLIWVKKLFLLENRLTTNLAEWSENISRFSTYLTYLDMGRSRQESATRAKEITTNFDRRGTWSSGINAAYAFFNARVQGIKRYGDLWKKNPGIMATWTAFDMALGFALAALMDSWYGDDPDEEGTKKGDKVNRFVRHNYLNIPVPGSDKLISIPNPHSFAFFHAIGSTLYDVMSGKMDGKEALSFSFDAFANNLIPIDLGGAFNNEGRLSARPIVPTFFVPIYDLIVNEDFAGRMIYREPFTKDLEKKLSPSQLYMNGTNRMLRVITDAAYQATGGDLETGMRYYYEGGKKKRAWGGEVNPSAIEHIIETTLSGKGQFYNQLFKIAIRSLEKNKEPLQSYDIPVVSRFVRTAWGDPIKDKFYDNIREAGDIISAYKMAKGVIEQGNVLNEIGRTRYENAKEIIKINNQIRDINEDLASSKVTQAHKDLLMKKKRENMRKINQLEL